MTYELVCISVESVENSILLIRGKKVILDRVLARFYGVSTSALNQAVKRNPERFPPDFRFQLTIEETRALEPARKQKAPQGKHVKYRPYVFTEHGILMLSTVLRSDRAIQVNIQIVRTFIRLREWLASNEELRRRLDEVKRTCDGQFTIVFKAIRKLMIPPGRKRNPIGFVTRIPRK